MPLEARNRASKRFNGVSFERSNGQPVTSSFTLEEHPVPGSTALGLFLLLRCLTRISDLKDRSRQVGLKKSLF
jgi:hypothetical protein